MCKVISVSCLDSVARSFVDSFGGYGIVADEELLAEETIREEEVLIEEVVTLVRSPKAIQTKGMW